ncbi:hypothetical protein AcV7_001430 [Taiwanofungus camphoratus]|nr:hypothetical protein AcV7_001430 [Antrodia cinnamomea]
MGPVPLKGGDYVLVQGTGGVSIFGLQLAVASGATVIATSSLDDKLKVAAKLGAKHLINYKKTPDWEKEVLKIISDERQRRGPYCRGGRSGTLEKSVKAVRYAGWIHIIGFVAGAGGDMSSLPVQVIGKAAVLRGIMIGSRAQFESMNRLITENRLKPVVDKVFSFEQARQAYEYLDSQKHVGKVVIKVSKN